MKTGTELCWGRSSPECAPPGPPDTEGPGTFRAWRGVNHPRGVRRQRPGRAGFRGVRLIAQPRRCAPPNLVIDMKLPPLGQLGPFIALAIACVFFAFTTERFFSAQNLSLILQQVMVVGVIAIGQTLIILTAGIDLVRHGDGARQHRDDQVRRRPGAAHPDRRACGIGVTALFGLLNGLLVTRIKLPPFIVTLGTFNIAFAITQLYSNAQTVTDLPSR